MGALVSRRWFRLVALLMPLLAAGGLGFRWWAGRPAPGEVRPNPRAEIDPGRRYVLRYWDYRWPTAPDGTAYEAWLREALAEFGRRFPNVRVEHRLLDPISGDADLVEALRRGDPPDVFATLPGGAVLYDRTLQVPADLYLTREERGGKEAPPAYLEAALAAASAHGRLWGWPRWMAAHVWLGHRQAMAAAGLDPDGVAREGWDWNAFAAALAARPDAVAGLAVNTAGTGVFEDLMHAQGIASPFGPDGSPRWTRDALRTVAAWLADLRHNEHLPLQAESSPDAMVDRILNGRVMVLAGANPWLTAKLLYTQPGTPGDLVLLPVPVPPGDPPALRVSAGSLLVFRQKDYRGHDHTRAAVELARHLSRLRHPWAVPGSGVFPSHRAAYEPWLRASAAYGPAIDDAALAWAGAPPGRTRDEAAREARWRDETLAPAVTAFWAGELDAAGLAARAGADPARPAAPAPPPWWRRLLPGAR